MNGSRRLPGLTVIGLVLVVLAAGCERKTGSVAKGQRKTPVMSSHTKLSWNSPRMRELEGELQLLWDAPRETINARDIKSMWRERMAACLIEKRLSKQDAADLAAACKELPVDPSGWDRFVNAVMPHVIRSLDREGLVAMLSVRCPYYCGDEYSLEFCLAARALWGDKLKDPVSVLGEAYVRCQIPKVRSILIDPIRSAFAGHGIKGNDDAEFVKNATQWYAKNKDHLALSKDYLYRGGSDSGPPPPWVLKDPQFFEKRLIECKGKPLLAEKPTSHESVGHRKPESAGSKTFSGALRRENNRTEAQELADLQRAWEVVTITRNGMLVPQEKVNGGRFVFREETMTEIEPDGTKFMEFRIRLDSTQEPRAIDLTRTIYKLRPAAGAVPSALDRLIEELNEDTTAAVYELRGDSLRICCPPIGSDRRPASFDTEEGSGEESFTMRRVLGW